MTAMFQSSPFPKEGRYVVEGIERDLDAQFQSSPFPKEGRYKDPLIIDDTKATFQSSPFPKEGRYLVGLGHKIEKHGVSILALPEGRALRYAYAHV